MILLTDPDPEVRTEIGAAMNGRGPVTETADLQRVVDHLQEDAVDVLVLGPGHPHERVLKLAERVERSRSDTGLVMLAPALEPERLREAMRAGVRDVIEFPPDPEELEEAVDRAAAAGTVQGGADGRDRTDRGQVVTVFNTKGGTGKSVISSNLALLLREESDDVALVDLDLESGDLGVMLRITPRYTIHDAATEPERLDEEALSGYLTEDASGVDVLAAPPEPSLAEAVGENAIERILEVLRSTHEHVIVDGPASFSDQILAALDVTDRVVLVAALDIPSIKNLKLTLDALRELGWRQDRIHVVLNRAQSDVGLRVKDVRRNLEADIDVVVPASTDVPRSINEGRPLAASDPGSDVVEAIADLLPPLGVERHDDQGLLRRLFS